MPEAAEDTPQAHSTLPPKPPTMHGRAMPSTVRCLHHIWKGSTCRLCLDVCPASAITVSSTVTIDRQACFDCGLCAVVCPTDGIIPSALAHENLYQRIKSRIKEHGVETLYLTCSQTEVEGASDWVYTVPCLGDILPELWYALRQEYDLRVYLPDGLCLDCPAYTGADLMFDQVEEAQEWLGENIPLAGSWNRLHIPEAALEEGPNRRTMLRDLALRLGDASTGKETLAVREHKAQQERLANLGVALATDDVAKNAADASGSKRYVTSRRRMLLNLLGHHPEWEDDIQVTVARTTASCISCGDCCQVCPTGARRTTESAGTSFTATSVAHCVGCGTCLAVCRRQGVDLGVADGHELTRGLAERARANEDALLRRREQREARRRAAEERRDRRIREQKEGLEGRSPIKERLSEGEPAADSAASPAEPPLTASTGAPAGTVAPPPWPADSPQAHTSQGGLDG